MQTSNITGSCGQVCYDEAVSLDSDLKDIFHDYMCDFTLISMDMYISSSGYLTKKHLQILKCQPRTAFYCTSLFDQLIKRLDD